MIWTTIKITSFWRKKDTMTLWTMLSKVNKSTTLVIIDGTIIMSILNTDSRLNIYLISIWIIPEQKKIKCRVWFLIETLFCTFVTLNHRYLLLLVKLSRICESRGWNKKLILVIWYNTHSQYRHKHLGKSADYTRMIHTYICLFIFFPYIIL